MTKKTLRKMALPGALVLGLGTAATAVEVVRTSVPDLDAQAATAPAPQPGDAGSLATAFRTASRGAFPAVVHIRVENAARAVASRVPEELRGTPFEHMFGNPQMRGAPSQSSGSGFIVSDDGYVLTNNHVVAQASRVTVVLTDKREYDAEVVGRDPNTDIAVLKVDARGLPTVRLGSSEALQTGDWVLALGYPLSLGETTTAGIVSAKGKSIGIMERNEGATAPLEHFIQTDAVINPGNSGGPLIDLAGRVVGVNSAIASPTGYYNGYGFAVPIDLAKRVADDLIAYGAVRRPMIGVQIRDVSLADQEVFRLDAARGAVVASEPSGPAADAGIELGDVIVTVDGHPVKDTGELMERVALRRPGDRIPVEVVRYGDRKRLMVTLGTMETERADEPREAARRSEDAPTRLGFRADEVDAATARRMRLPGAGVVVTDVDPMGPAAAALPRGLLIEKVNGRAVRSLDDLRAAADGLRAGQAVSLIGRTAEGRQVIVNYRLRG